MKKRNTTIFAFLLLAAVGMGVGYAALTTELEMIGQVGIKNEQAQEEFTKEVTYVKDAEVISYKDAIAPPYVPSFLSLKVLSTKNLRLAPF